MRLLDAQGCGVSFAIRFCLYVLFVDGPLLFIRMNPREPAARNVVFQDVGFQNTVQNLITHIRFQVWGPHAFSFWVSINYYYQTPHPQTPHPWTPDPRVWSGRGRATGKATQYILACGICRAGSDWAGWIKSTHSGGQVYLYLHGNVSSIRRPDLASPG